MDRAEFWKSCMLVGNDRGVRRLVGYSENVEEGRKGYEADADADIRIWVPKDENDEFNLVLSLCENGKHAWMMDLDCHAEAISDGALAVHGIYGNKKIVPKPNARGAGYPWVLVPSSSNWHAYCADSTEWCDMSSFFTPLMLGSDFDKWVSVSQAKGYFALRPPWVLKPEAAKAKEAQDRKRAAWDQWEAHLKAGGSLGERLPPASLRRVQF